MSSKKRSQESAELTFATTSSISASTSSAELTSEFSCVNFEHNAKIQKRMITTIFSFPYDIFNNIFEMFELKTILPFSLVCKKFAALMEQYLANPRSVLNVELEFLIGYQCEELMCRRLHVYQFDPENSKRLYNVPVNNKMDKDIVIEKITIRNVFVFLIKICCNFFITDKCNGDKFHVDAGPLGCNPSWISVLDLWIIISKPKMSKIYIASEISLVNRVMINGIPIMDFDEPEKMTIVEFYEATKENGYERRHQYASSPYFYEKCRKMAERVSSKGLDQKWSIFENIGFIFGFENARNRSNPDVEEFFYDKYSKKINP